MQLYHSTPNKKDIIKGKKICINKKFNYNKYLEYILTNSNKVAFIEALLELLYKYFEIHEVSELPIFKDYLRSMEDSL